MIVIWFVALTVEAIIWAGAHVYIDWVVSLILVMRIELVLSLFRNTRPYSDVMLQARLVTGHSHYLSYFIGLQNRVLSSL